MTNARTDVAVVGGGLAGLTAAVAAARAGARVTLFDSRAVGGRARSIERDGYTLNEGAHALYANGAALATLRALGVEPAGAPPDPATYRLVWDGEIVPLPTGPKALATTRILSARSKVKFAGWYANLPGQAARAAGMSVGEWLDAERAGDDLRKLILALMRLGSYSATPERAAASALIRHMGLGAGGVVYVDGGWQSIVDRLVDVALSHGVAIVDHEAVRAVTELDAEWSVSTAAREVGAGAVVLAAGGPAVVTSLLGDDPAGWVERAGPVQRAAVLDIGGPPAEHRFLLSADEPLYLSTHAPVAKLAPEGEHLVTLMRYLAADDTNGATENRAALEAHAALAGAAAVGARTVDRFLAAPVVTWGSPVAGVERPTGLELAARGVFAAGDWVGEHLLADSVVASGNAAGLAAARRVVIAA